jgi:hypothetical protein
MAKGKRISADIGDDAIQAIKALGAAAKLARTSVGEGQAAAAARLGVHVQTAKVALHQRRFSGTTEGSAQLQAYSRASSPPNGCGRQTDAGGSRNHIGALHEWRSKMAQHAITAVHLSGGKIDLVAIHQVVEKEFGSTEFSLGTAQRISVGECADLIVAGEEVCLARRTESHTWEVICDVKLLPGGAGITGVDIVDRPNNVLQELPVWD